MLVTLLLAALVAAPLPTAAPPLAVPAVPGEPGAVVLPDDEPTFQAVAADLDGDGARELVRLIGVERGGMRVEAWTQRGEGWAPLASAVDVIPGRPTGAQGDVQYAGTPVRLVVRRIDRGDRVTIVRQPRFEEPATVDECCLLLNDVVLRDGQLSLVSVADPGTAVGAVTAIDLDGDGTDELLASRSLPPLGDIGFPSEMRVYRWSGDSFGPPTITQLGVGSGDTPFVLGDSDGERGDEAAIISTIGRPALYRLSLAQDDQLLVEDAGFVVTDALAVPLGDGRGIAVLGPTVELAVAPWPRGELPGPPVGTVPMDQGTILGAVEILDEPHLVVRQTDPEALHLLALPDLSPARGNPVTRSPAAAALASGPLRPYVGPLPGGGLDGDPAVIYAGRLLPSSDLPEAPFATLDTAIMATLAGAEPVGLVGEGRSWLAIQHVPLALPRIDPGGGRLDAPTFPPASGVSIAPVGLVRTAERDDGALEPELLGAAAMPGGVIAFPPSGFTAVVAAPPGSRVYVTDLDPSVIGDVHVVPSTGIARVPVLPPSGPPSVAYRASFTVITPGGHAYAAGWDLRVLDEPPPIEADVATALGSSDVDVSGRTASYATVTVDGGAVEVDAEGRFSTQVSLPPWPTDIEVVAADPFGLASTVELSGVGFFDYRGLPWVPITVLLVALAAVMLLLRVPRATPTPRTPDDAVLEELDPD